MLIIMPIDCISNSICAKSKNKTTAKQSKISMNMNMSTYLQLMASQRMKAAKTRERKVWVKHNRQIGTIAAGVYLNKCRQLHTLAQTVRETSQV
jgi:hypothetical protein